MIYQIYQMNHYLKATFDLWGTKCVPETNMQYSQYISSVDCSEISEFQKPTELLTLE